MKKEKILITAALPYANGSIHFGHLAGSFLPADVYARYKRLKGCDVAFISGSDEYGIAILLSAELAGRTPKQQVDYFHAINKSLLQKMQISFDHFSRTTSKEHAPLVQAFFLDLLHNGYIEEKVTEQLYSDQEGRFLADRYVVGTCPKCGFVEARGDECPKCGGNYEATDLKMPRSKLTGAPLKLKETKHWFLRCDLFKERLKDWIETREFKSNVANFIKPYIEELKPRAITRDTDWGVPIPLEGTEGKVLYVWFDAPIGYISATKEWSEKRWKEFWLDPATKYVQFLGKDNIPFHAMIFPAMQMGQNIPYKMVDEMPANEFLNLEGKKFSKSSGWYIDLAEFLEKFPVDTLRYTLAANAPETQDSEFTFADFQMRVNTELVGKLGNFVHRTLTFLHDRMGQKIPESPLYDEIDNAFYEKMHDLMVEIGEHYETFGLRKATQTIMELASLANSYFDQKKPWVLLRDKEKQEELATTIYLCLMAIKSLAVAIYPIMPETSEKMGQLIGFKHPIGRQNWDEMVDEELTPGAPLKAPVVLFQKIEDEVIAMESEKFKNIAESNLMESIDFETFTKVDLRVAKVLHVEKVAKSNKLLKFTVDLGFEQRTIVSGIAKYVENPEVLIGKKILIVANLKPVKLMGIESQGMILSAVEGDHFELPHFETIPMGTSVR